MEINESGITNTQLKHDNSVSAYTNVQTHTTHTIIQREAYLAITSDKSHAMTGVDSVFAESAEFSSVNKERKHTSELASVTPLK
jgi:hypothetical protein